MRNRVSTLLLCKTFFHEVKQCLGDGVEDLIFFPDDIAFTFEARGEWTETEVGGIAGIDEFIEADHDAESGMNENSAVVRQIKGGDDVEAILQITKKFRVIIGDALHR